MGSRRGVTSGKSRSTSRAGAPSRSALAPPGPRLPKHPASSRTASSAASALTRNIHHPCGNFAGELVHRHGVTMTAVIAGDDIEVVVREPELSALCSLKLERE